MEVDDGRNKKAADPGAFSSTVVVKRATQRPGTGKTDVYVARGSVDQALIKRIEMLLKTGRPYVRIHGMGALIGRAINLALKLESRGKGTLKLETTINTVINIDDVMDINTPSLAPVSRERKTSAVIIKVSRVADKL